MKNYMSRINIFIGILLLVSLSSCHIGKPFFIKNKKKEDRKEKRAERKAVRGNLVTVVVDSALLAGKSNAHTFNDELSVRAILTKHHLDYKTFQCKAKMHFESGEEKQNFTANFRLEKGTKIWLSINAPLIGEVARALITPDSVKAFERINKRAYLYSYHDIQKLINIQVDFATLQEIIIGNAISTEGNITEVKELGTLRTIFIKGEEFINQLTYFNSDSTLKQLQLQTGRAVSKSSILIAYSKYELSGLRKFSSMRNYYIQDVKGAASLDMDINKFEFDIPIEFPFSIPSNYKLKE